MRRWLHRMPKAYRRPASPPRRLEQLEPRLLLSANVLYAVNAGGPEVTGPDSVIWAKDKKGGDYPYNNASAASSGSYNNSTPVDTSHASIPVTAPTAIFQSLRHDSSRGENLKWNFPVPPGTYDVRLYFAELDSDATAGSRVFDVTAEGQTVLDDYDVHVAAGGNFKGIVETLRINADSSLDLEFIRHPNTSDNPQINAIEILSVAAPNQLDVEAQIVDFGEVEVGGTVTRQVTVTNVGSDGDPAITFGPGGFTLGDGSRFTIEDLNGQTLAPGASLTFDVIFDASTIGSGSATYAIGHSGTNGPLVLTLSGEAVAPVPNTPPTVAPIGNKTVEAGQVLDVPVSASDAQGHAVALSANYNGGALPPFITFTDNGDGTGNLHIVPQIGNIGSFNGITITATETGTAEGLSGSTSFNLNVASAPDTQAIAWRINAGGPTIDDTVDWVKDKNLYNSDSSSGSASTSQSVDTSHGSVPAGTPMALFQSLRHDSSRGENLKWNLAVAPGTYDVRLYFAEIDSGVTSPGQRIFDVQLQGQTVLNNYDVYAAAGGGFKGIVETFRVTANGAIDLEFIRDAATSKNPQINGIEIIAVAAANELSTTDETVAFGEVEVGGTATRQVTVTNLGGPGDPTITFGVGSFTAGDGSRFTIEDLNGQTLAPGASLTFDVTFDASTLGSGSATFEIPHSGTNGPLVLTLSGEAVAQPTNTPPTVAPIANQTVQAGQVLDVAVSASDAQGHALALSASYNGGSLPPFITFTDNGNGTGTLHIAPQAGDVGNLQDITITATETGTPQGLSASTSFDLSVTAAPDTAGIVWRVNAGGSKIDDTVDWVKDKDLYNSDAKSGPASTSQPIDITSHGSVPAGTPMQLFQSHRHDPSSGTNLGFNLDVADGFYEVRLFFAETDASAFVGSRVFSVDVEGVRVLNDFDLFSEAGLFTGVMKSFVVEVTDGKVDIDFSRHPDTEENPFISGIEVRQVSRTPLAVEDNGLYPTAIDFGNVQRPGSSTRTLRLHHTGAGPLVIQNVQTIGGAFTESFSGPVELSPGQTHLVDVTFTPGATGPDDGILRITYTINGQEQTLDLDLSGSGVDAAPIGFGKSQLVGLPDLGSPTSLQFGPDGRLYVGYQNGTIGAYTIARNSANSYQVTGSQIITLVRHIPNHNDNGQVVQLGERLLTGILVTGTAAQPVIYATSSDPRGGSGGDANVDTNSGVLSRLTWNGSQWEKVDLVRGLPRSEEKHSANGMQLDAQTNTLYIAYGGNTNAGGPSAEFGGLPEYAYSAAILSIDLDAIDAMSTKTDPVHGHAYKYDLPTLDDESRDFDGNGSDTNIAAGIQDVFGGNNGKNQARITPDSPVQVFAPGFRNPYDVLLHSNGQMYTVDNGANLGWGDAPDIDDNGTPNDPSDDYATNGPAEHGNINIEDMLHRVSGPGYYGGHPNPTRANTNNTFNPSNPQSPVNESDPRQSFFTVPQTVAEGAMTTFTASTNGLTEYTASNFGGQMQGDLLTASFFGGNTLWRLKLNEAGDQVVLKQALFTSVGTAPLDVTTVGDGGAFAGTIWVADYSQKSIIIFEPSDFAGGGGPGDPNDLDGDGYTNDDELANGTDPNNGGDVPPDNDTDFVSDLNDANDDNDALDDVDDSFALDSTNGQNQGPVQLNMDNLADGLFDLGFTGLMRDGTNDWLDNLNLDPAGTTGGAGEVLTLANIGSGTALGTVNTQQNAMQFGVNPELLPEQFSVTARLLSPFAGGGQAGQQMGIYFGTGDQSNFMQVVLNGSGHVQWVGEVGDSTGPTTSSAVTLAGLQSIDLYIRVDQATGQATAAYRANYAGGSGDIITLPGSFAVPASWLNSPIAVGVIATNGGAAPFAATWDFIQVGQDNANRLGVDVASVDFGKTIPGSTATRTITLTNRGAAGDPAITIHTATLGGDGVFDIDLPSSLPITLAAGESVELEVTFNSSSEGTFAGNLTIAHSGEDGPIVVALEAEAAVAQSSAKVVVASDNTNIKRSSTYGTESFQITNTAADGSRISRVTIDVTSAVLPDLIFDPHGTGGDTTGRNLTKPPGFDDDTGYTSHGFELALDGGYQRLVIDFSDFDPGEEFIFGLDMDPTSVKGTSSPGPNHGASVSGMELTGSIVTIEFEDGTVLSNTLFRKPGTEHGSETVLKAGVPTQAVSIAVPGVTTQTLHNGAEGALVAGANQSVRITGPAGATVRLLVLDAGLYIADGGFDVDLMEANSVAKMAEHTVVIGASGFVDVPVVLTQRQESGWEDVTGYNHLIATIVNPDGATGPTSNVIVLKYDQSPALDFGDAGGAAPTTLAQDGARHLIPSGPSDPQSPILGDNVDAESNGTPTADASADGSDEDGLVSFAAIAGQTGQLQVEVSNGSGYLSAWLDLNGDGDFSDPGEQILSATAVTEGVNALHFAVPATATAGETTLRLRLSPTAEAIGASGLVLGGEVEDHRVTIQATPDLATAATVPDVAVRLDDESAEQA